MNRDELKERAIELRKQGLLYCEICSILGIDIPRGTLSGWLRSVKLSPEVKLRLKQKYIRTSHSGQRAAVAANKAKREKYLQQLLDDNQKYAHALDDVVTAKCALAMLYLAEGGKSANGTLVFGNADPGVIALYLRLLHQCYKINPQKFRARIQCRSDQNKDTLEMFWSDITCIPRSQFYPTYSDKRTIGKPTRKPGYQGVLCLTYLSGYLFQDIMATIRVIMGR